MRSAAAIALGATILVVALFANSLAHAGDPASPSASAAASASAARPVEFHWKGGPQTFDLGNDISLALPEAYAFLGGPEAGKLLEKNGSFHNANLVGLVVSKSESAH